MIVVSPIEGDGMESTWMCLCSFDMRSVAQAPNDYRRRKSFVVDTETSLPTLCKDGKASSLAKSCNESRWLEYERLQSQSPSLSQLKEVSSDHKPPGTLTWHIMASFVADGTDAIRSD
jgi:hypothetical protein